MSSLQLLSVPTDRLFYIALPKFLNYPDTYFHVEVLLYLSVLLISEISALIAPAQPTAPLLDLLLSTHLLNPHLSRAEHSLFPDLAYLLYVVLQRPLMAASSVISVVNRKYNLRGVNALDARAIATEDGVLYFAPEYLRRVQPYRCSLIAPEVRYVLAVLCTSPIWYKFFISIRASHYTLFE